MGHGYPCPGQPLAQGCPALLKNSLSFLFSPDFIKPSCSMHTRILHTKYERQSKIPVHSRIS